MCRRSPMLTILVVTLLAGVVLAPSSGAAETEADSWTVARTADGYPDLQGVWANNNATPLERPEAWQGKKELSSEELEALKESANRATNGGEDALFGDQLVLAAIAREKATSYDPTTGNYNQFWVADRVFDNRTSLIIDPPDGRLPEPTPEAKERRAARMTHRAQHPADSWEDRSLSERCISYGAPRIGAGYNSYYQIIQNADHVVILMEMIHDARIIPIDRPAHLDDGVRLLHGDSRGHWEGDTLVIETTNYSPKTNFRGASDGLFVTERLTRRGATELEYEVTIEDPTTWTKPWTVMILLKETGEQIFEYACHEGNYGMEGILAGHRTQEREAAASATGAAAGSR